ncbi:MAG: amidohydrolase [Fluviicola sp.]
MKSISQLKEIRKHLHQNPELSGEEFRTSEYIQNLLKESCPSASILKLTETGFIAHFRGEKSIPSVMLRCELDALPIEEVNTFEHRSEIPNVSHKCGHDGHMTILLSVAFALEKQKPAGDVYLLFQPAEETGEGAQEVLKSSAFAELPEPDFTFALHNLPGTPLHSIHVKEEEITPSVISVEIQLTGTTSHAAEPQKGKNPDLFISELLQWANYQSQPNPQVDNFQIITAIFVSMGSEDYGISAGNASAGLTLRTSSNSAMELLKERIEKKLDELSELYGIQVALKWKYSFKGVQNASIAAEYVRESAKANDLKLVNLEAPFPWGEDYGAFTEQITGALFGLGAGEDCPALHNPDYDFPDALIETGSKMFQHLIAISQK